MANILMRSTSGHAGRFCIDGVNYDPDAQGNYAVPAAAFRLVLDSRLMVPTDSFASLAAANASVAVSSVQPGAGIFLCDSGTPVWRNTANNGWVGADGSPVT